MTETEKLLLSALERLQNDSKTQQQALLDSFRSLQAMYEKTRQENQALANHCTKLNQQVEGLSKQVNDLSNIVNRLARL
ncbi:MbeD family mobilization/exclusion protein [Kluyvera sichuanensis]|uniref:MbeD family mobilization/exclusion protein n=1 Tax=Kluyvera sichuanensis TaxID=2725494 RepID=UPI0039F531D9